jgi:hypothetical protein
VKLSDLLVRLDAGDELHREAASALRRAADQHPGVEAREDARDSYAEGRWAESVERGHLVDCAVGCRRKGPAASPALTVQSGADGPAGGSSKGRADEVGNAPKIAIDNAAGLALGYVRE